MRDPKRELLKRALLESRLNEFETIPSKENTEQEHMFSLSFERKMKSVIQRKRISDAIKKAGKYAAGFAVICGLTGTAFLIIQRNNFSFDKMASNNTEVGEAVCDNDKTIFTEGSFLEGYVDEDSVASSSGNKLLDDIPSEKDIIYESDMNIITSIYKENENTVISIDCADSEILSQSIEGYLVTYSVEDISGLNETTNGISSDIISDQSGATDIILDKALYDIYEEDGRISCIIDSMMLLDYSGLNIYLETETKVVRLSFEVNGADGMPELIK